MLNILQTKNKKERGLTMDKKSFLLYLDYEEHFSLLTDEQAGQLIKVIFQYEKTGEIPEIEGVIKMAFSFIKSQLDRDSIKWKEETKKRSDAGKKGMLSRWKNKKEEEKNNTDNSVIKDKNTDMSTKTNDKTDSDYNKNNNVTNVITKDNSVKSVITRYNTA